jgi:hypothetical protein
VWPRRDERLGAVEEGRCKPADLQHAAERSTCDLVIVDNRNERRTSFVQHRRLKSVQAGYRQPLLIVGAGCRLGQIFADPHLSKCLKFFRDIEALTAVVFGFNRDINTSQLVPCDSENMFTTKGRRC